MESEPKSSDSPSSNPSPAPPLPSAPRVEPFWIKVFPFFTSGILFLSFLFSVFAPFPLLLMHLRRGMRWGALAFLTNTLWVFLIGGYSSAALYVVFVGSLYWGLSLIVLNRHRSVEWACVGIFGLAVVLSLLLIQISGWVLSQPHPFEFFITETRRLTQMVIEQVYATRMSEFKMTPEQLAHVYLRQFPSAIAISMIVSLWLNFSLLVRIHPQWVQQHLKLTVGYLSQWKAPEWMVWPAIVSAAGVLFGAGVLSEVALNFFKVFATIYGIQGLSIMAEYFNKKLFSEWFRLFTYLFILLLLPPFLALLGFFDLWFDFRSKIRQI